MKSSFLGFLCGLAISGALFSAKAETSYPVLPLWPDGAPGALGTNQNDIPTLTVYLPKPELATGAAIVICPGGGYAGLASHEGVDYALWLNEQGIAGFVLKYRLGTSGYHHPSMVQDAARAVRLVRSKAAEWNLDKARVGIMGSSAGGHLASTLMTHFDAGNTNATDVVEQESSRPDLGILCYPVITMGQLTHGGSKNNLLGEKPSQELVWELSNELQVTPQTPRCFIWHTFDDTIVPVENSLQFADALRKANVPFDLHIYQHGNHGMGLGGKYSDPASLHPWTADCRYWLKELKFGK